MNFPPSKILVLAAFCVVTAQPGRADSSAPAPVSASAENTALAPLPAPVQPPAAAPAPTADMSSLAVGVGYPDLRLRFGLGPHWSLEAKGAFAQGLQIYSGRVSWDFGHVGPLRALLGAECGWAKFDGLDSISGNGVYGEGFAGLEYPFARRLRLTVDVGPAWLQASAQDHSLSTVDVIFNTALYFYLF
jgi:hypothetical protein